MVIFIYLFIFLRSGLWILTLWSQKHHHLTFKSAFGEWSINEIQSETTVDIHCFVFITGFVCDFSFHRHLYRFAIFQFHSCFIWDFDVSIWYGAYLLFYICRLGCCKIRGVLPTMLVSILTWLLEKPSKDSVISSLRSTKVRNGNKRH